MGIERDIVVPRSAQADSVRTKIEWAPGSPPCISARRPPAVAPICRSSRALQIVESRREGAAVRQQVIATLGRIEDLQESGQLEWLLRSGARFSEKAIVLDAQLDRGEAAAISTRRIGPALAFERVWEETGCRDVIERQASARKHDFSLERAAFLTVLHRLFCGGSDRAADAKIIASTVPRASSCIISIAVWRGSAKSFPKTSRMPRRRFRRAA